jgi:hypothetical protein
MSRPVTTPRATSTGHSRSLDRHYSPKRRARTPLSTPWDVPPPASPQRRAEAPRSHPPDTPKPPDPSHLTCRAHSVHIDVPTRAASGPCRRRCPAQLHLTCRFYPSRLRADVPNPSPPPRPTTRPRSCRTDVSFHAFIPHMPTSLPASVRPSPTTHLGSPQYRPPAPPRPNPPPLPVW